MKQENNADIDQLADEISLPDQHADRNLSSKLEPALLIGKCKFTVQLPQDALDIGQPISYYLSLSAPGSQ